MTNILAILGVKEQGALPKSYIDAGRLIDGMQGVYDNAPESNKKDLLATAIAESVRVLIISLSKLNLGVGAISKDDLQKENDNLPQEFKVILPKETPLPEKKKESQTKETPELPTPKNKKQRVKREKVVDEVTKKLLSKLEGIEN